MGFEEVLLLCHDAGGRGEGDGEGGGCCSAVLEKVEEGAGVMCVVTAPTWENIQYNTMNTYNVMRYNSMQSHTVQYNIMQGNIMQYYAKQHSTMRCREMQCNVMLCNTVHKLDYL